MKQREAGFSTILVVLMTAIVLIGVLTTSATVISNQRQTSGNELAALKAVLASESGHEAFRAASSSRPFRMDVPNCSGLLANSCYQSAYTAGFKAYLDKINPINFTGGSTTLTVQSVSVNGAGVLSSLNLTSTSRIGGDTARVVRSYQTHRTTPGFLHLPGAVTSYPEVDMGGDSSVSGLTISSPSNTGVLTNFLTLQNPSTVLVASGQHVQMTVADTDLERLSQLRVGQYVQLPVAAIAGLAAGTATFRVSALGQGSVTLDSLANASPVTLNVGSTPLTNVFNGVVSSFGSQLTVNALESFFPGDQLAITVNGVTYTTTVNTVSGATVNTQMWSVGAPASFPEGSVVVKSTNAVVTAGAYSPSKNMTAANGAALSGGQGGALLNSPLNAALFTQVMNLSPADFRTMSNVVPLSNFDGSVSGLTWLDLQGASGANLNSQKVNGQGVLVVDGDLTLNNNGGACAFNGVLVVRGTLKMAGNLQVCGALFVEGAFIASDGLSVSGIDGNNATINGTGNKVAYNAAVVLDALRGAGPYTFGSAGTWRQL